MNFLSKENVNNKSTDRINCFSSTPKHLFASGFWNLDYTTLWRRVFRSISWINLGWLFVGLVFIVVYIIQQINDMVRIEIQISVYLVPRHGVLLFIYVHSFTAWTCCSTSEKWGNHKAINFWNVVIVLKL